jgi:hypothetical protein
MFFLQIGLNFARFKPTRQFLRRTPGQQERTSDVGTAGARRLVPGADNYAQRGRGLTGENQKLEYLPKVAKMVLQC